ncbi:polyhydroxyalkanoate depolymerase [Cupriavidus necator]
MLYQLYQTYADVAAAYVEAGAAAHAAILRAWPGFSSDTLVVRAVAAAHELFAVTRFRHERPEFGIPSVTVKGREALVAERIVHRTPFCSLLHFRKEAAVVQPRVLAIAPMAGHFATLLRGTVGTLLADHDVFLTDWHNARDVPLSAGGFGFDEFVKQLMDVLELLGADTHVIAVCQPTVATLAAVALLAQDRSAAQPRSMTLIAGPNDTRINPTKIDEFATRTPLEWFENHAIDRVPRRFKGAMRRVYPGFLQLCAFILMNPERHTRSLSSLYRYRVQGQSEKARAIREFYEEYFTTMDLPAELYLDTVRKVFQENALATGKLQVLGRRVEPRSIDRTVLLTVEGGLDDVCGLGQTEAAREICAGLPRHMKFHYVQAGVGHYGVFHGRYWETQVYPIVKAVIDYAEHRRWTSPAARLERNATS